MALGPWLGEDAGVRRVSSFSILVAVMMAVVLASAALSAEPVGAVLVRPELRTEVRNAWPSSEPPRENVAVPASPTELEGDAGAGFQVSVEPLSDESYVAVAEVEAPAREVTRHVLRDKELTQIPGTSGDALRAIEILPGVARTSISMAMPLLRGAGWHESRSYIDGATVPLLFHLGGVKSAFNSQLLSAVELYPSNPRSAYGRGTGGVVAAEVRAPRSDRAHLLGEVSVLDSMLLAETPLSPNAAVAVAVRRSNLDWFYDAVAPKGDFSMVALPVYYDYQGVGALRLSPRHELGLLVYGSRDSLGLEFAQPSDFDPAIRDRVEYALDYHRLQASLQSDLSPAVEQRLQVTYGVGRMRQRLGATRIDLREHDLFSRGEWRLRLGERVSANLGYDLESQRLRGSYVGNRPPQAEGEVQNGSSSTEASVDLGRGGTDRGRARGHGAHPTLSRQEEASPVARAARRSDMSAPLEDAVRSLRDLTAEGGSKAEGLTRARILAEVRRERQRRLSRWALLVPMAAILVGSAAYAMTGGSAGKSLARLRELFGEPPSDTATVPQKPAGLKVSRPEVAPPQPSPSVAVLSSASSAALSASASPRPGPSVARSAATASDEEARRLEQELRLHERAHHAHFVAKDDASALRAWDEYLALPEAGRFVPEARYNRGLCLLRLGRTEEAKGALRAFADGAYGRYRQAEARALLERLEERPEPEAPTTERDGLR